MCKRTCFSERLQFVIPVLAAAIFASDHALSQTPADNPPPAVSPLSLPQPVTTGALQMVRLFAEPLTPVGGSPSEADNTTLAATLQRYAASRDLAELSAFVEASPASPWRVSVLTNLGLLEFDAGYFSRALAHWTQAWNIGKAAPNQSRDADAIVVRALAEALKMNCRVGRVDDAKALLAELGERPLSGLNATMIDVSRKAVIQMETMPKDCFKCGPFAVSSILAHNNQHTAETINVITAFPTTAQGTSLAQVMELANGPLGMQMQAAKRASASAPILVPAVINWKLNHYGALLKEEGGRYLMTDPTFGTSQWIDADAINQESSGYFLVPAGPLPEGWAAVEEAEAGTVWGRGDCAVGDGNGTGPNAPKKGGGGGCGMAGWSVHHSLASLNIDDTPLFYDPPAGPPVHFRVNYSQLEQNQPTTINYSNIGALWNFSWVSYLTFDSANARARMGEGGTELYTNFNGATGTYSPDQSSHARLVRVGENNYERRESDGSKMVFNLPDGTGRLFATQIVDPQGNALTMAYDANFRLVTMTDAVGQVTTLTHGSNTPGDPLFYLVTKVTDPFGRFTTLAYDASGRLTSVTDQIGISSIFTYTASNIVQTLSTPYGTTTFDCGSATLPVKGVVSHVQVTEPNGAQYRVESCQYSSTPASDAAVPAGMPLLNQYLNFRNSYYWDARAMLEAPGDYTKANITHFLHLNASNIKANVMESEKDPLESRVWYVYQNQHHNGTIYTNEGMGANPTHIGRVLDDGSTQLDRYSYNELGNMTQSIDPLGRTTNYIYAANGIDMLSVTQVNAQGGTDLLATLTWNSQHLPVTITDASGAVTTFAYNSRGQVTSMTNALGQTASYVYNAQGHLTTADGPLPGTGDRSTFTYDALGRTNTATNGEGHVVDFDYDDLDRITRVTFPDGSYEQVTYTNLDPTQIRDRMGRITTMAYDAAQQLISVTDPLNRVVKLDWCQCGSLRRMIDPLGRVTKWDEDIQGRTISKSYANGTKETYQYEATNSRVARMTDPNGQGKAFSYNLDDSVAAVTYLNAQYPTSGMSYTYDPAYPRRLSMTDGLGVTTYSYGGANGPGANLLKTEKTLWNGVEITYSYDALGRVTTRAINGVPNSIVHDAGGRATTLTNVLGSFGITYEGTSGRITGVTMPNGQSVTASYFGNTGDRRLQQLRNVRPNATTLSQSDFTYNAGGQIMGWNQQSSDTPALNYTMGYDAAQQLVSMNAASQTFGYSYDSAGNLKTKTVNAATITFTHNIINELQSATPALAADKTYLWDAEDRLIAIYYTGTSLNTQLKYDGLGRCVEITENNASTVTSVKRFVWCGAERCEERDASGNVTRRFFSQGEQIGGTSYYYAFDHLGSVREMTDSTGAIRARYTYDPYGVRTKVSGDLEASAGYTGHYFHAPSGLHLTRFRVYDAQTGRWLSRDPLREDAGLNMHAYVGNDPINGIDPLGLKTLAVGLSGGGFLGVGITTSFGVIADTQGNIGVYGGVDYGGGVAASLGVDGNFMATGAEDIYAATSGNSGGVGVSGALIGKVGYNGSTGQNADGSNWIGAGAAMGLGIGGGATATTGPSGAYGFNVPGAGRAAAGAVGRAANAAFGAAFGFNPDKAPAGPSAGKGAPSSGLAGRRIPAAAAPKPGGAGTRGGKGKGAAKGKGTPGKGKGKAGSGGKGACKRK